MRGVTPNALYDPECAVLLAIRSIGAEINSSHYERIDAWLDTSRGLAAGAALLPCPQ
jgi:hypothetical protein